MKKKFFFIKGEALLKFGTDRPKQTVDPYQTKEQSNCRAQFRGRFGRKSMPELVDFSLF